MTENSILDENMSEEAITDASVVDAEETIAVEHHRDVEPLTVKEAALLLGKSIRALERSLSGKWGNKLPDGWSAAKQLINGTEEWVIYPPEDFRYEHVLEGLRKPNEHSIQRIQAEDLLRPLRHHFEAESLQEVHGMLRELAGAHRELAEQRKLHIDDLHTLMELQSSMRLLEVNSGETAKLRAELVEAQKDLIGLKNQYKEFLALPWWKRLFKRLS
ncbi:MAG TPA: hypothetical protein V6C81_06315 [Planktothrix sp.]